MILQSRDSVELLKFGEREQRRLNCIVNKVEKWQAELKMHSEILYPV